MAATKKMREAFGRPLTADPKDWDCSFKGKRIVPMEVLVLGPPRTGTASMVEALKLLGYDRVHHMSACLEDPTQNVKWYEALMVDYHVEGVLLSRSNFDSLLGDCMAVTDFPAAAFPTELIRAYPEAKVILNTRPVDDWYRSICETIKPAFQSLLIYLFCITGDPFWAPWMHMLRAIWTVFSRRLDFLEYFAFGAGFFEEKNLKQRYLEHYQTIRDIVPAELLLEKDISEGWERMCEFLGKEVPSVPFPSVNDRAEFKKSMDGEQSHGQKDVVCCADSCTRY